MLHFQELQDGRTVVRDGYVADVVNQHLQGAGGDHALFLDSFVLERKVVEVRAQHVIPQHLQGNLAEASHTIATQATKTIISLLALSRPTGPRLLFRMLATASTAEVFWALTS